MQLAGEDGCKATKPSGFTVDGGLIGGVTMGILCFLAIWTFYFWLVQKCLRRSVAGMRARDVSESGAWEGGRMEIPDTVPSEWVEA